MTTTSLSTGTLLIGGIVGFFVGVAFAVTRRALADWRGAKAAVPKARETFFAGLWRTVKLGGLAVVVVALAGWWLVRDATGEHPLAPAPAGASSPAPSTSTTAGK